MEVINKERTEENEQVVELGQVSVLTLGGGYRSLEGLSSMRMYGTWRI